MRAMRITMLGLVFAAAACGDSAPLSVDDTGTLNVVLSDNPTAKVAAVSAAPWSSLIHHKVFGQNYFHGRFTGSLLIEVSKNGRDWIALGTTKALDMALQVEADPSDLVLGVEVPVGTYSYVRLETTSDVSVDAGSEIDGAPLAEGVSVVVGEGAPIEKRLSTPFVVTAGSPLTLSIDLNVEGWLSEENLQAGEIPATDVESAISVTPILSAQLQLVSPLERRT